MPSDETKNEELDIDDIIADFLDDNKGPAEAPTTDHDDKSLDQEGEKDHEDDDDGDEGREEELKETEDGGEETEEEEDRESEDGEEGEEEKEEGEEEEEEEDEISELKARNEALIDRLEKLAAGGAISPKPAPTPKPEGSEDGKDEHKKKKTDPLQFLGEDDDIDDVTSDKDLFNKALNKVYETIIEAIPAQLQGVFQQTVGNQIREQLVLKDAIDDFFDNNEDLKRVRSTVGLMTREVIAENPNAELGEVFDEAAKRTRELYGMKKKKIKPGKRKPALRRKTRSSNRRPVRDTRSTTQKEIDDLID